MGEKDDSVLINVFEGTVALFLGALISKALMYLYRIIVARELGAADYGLLNLSLTVFWITVNLSNAGITNGITRKVSQSIGEKKEERINKYLWSSIDFTLSLSILVGGTVFLAAGWISNSIFSKPGLELYLRLFSIGLPLQVLYKDLASYADAHKEVVYPMLVEKIYRSAFTLGVTYAVLYLGMGLNAVVTVQILAIASSSLIMAYLAQNKVRSFLSEFATSRSWERKDLVKYSYPLFLSGLVGITMGRIDNIFLGIFDTAETLGVYTAAFPTAQTITVVAGSLSTILFPTVSELYAKGEKQKSIEMTKTIMKWVISFSLPMTALLVVFANPILNLLFGETFRTGSTALAILGTAYLISNIFTYANNFINSEDRTKIIFYNSVAVAIINIGLNLILIPMYSQTGASIATAFAITFGSVIAAVEAYHFFGVQPFSFKTVFPPIMSTLLAGGTVYYLDSSMFEVTPKWALIPGGVIFGAIFAVTFLLTGGFSDRDVELMKKVEERRELKLEMPKKWFKYALDDRDRIVSKIR